VQTLELDKLVLNLDQTLELDKFVLNLDLLNSGGVINLSLSSLHLDELLGIGMNSRLFSVSKSFKKGIWLQAMKQVLDVLIGKFICPEDFCVELPNLILDCSWNGLSSLCLYTLCNLNYERIVVSVFFANLSKLVLLNLLFILSVLLLNLVRVLLSLFDVCIESVGPECKDNEEKEETECEPSFHHSHVSWRNTAEAKVKPDVGKERSNGSNCKNSSVLHFFRLFFYCHD